MSRFDVLHPHALPIQQVGEALGAVTLVDALALGFGGEVEHEGGELVDAVVNALGAAVDDVDAVVGGVFDELFHVAAKAGEVGRDGGDAHDGAFGGCVPPGFVVRAEDAQVRAAHEVVVVEWQDGVGGVEEFGVEDDFDAVGGVVEELDAANLVEDGVFIVVEHVVRDDGWEGGAFHGEEAPSKHDAVGGGEEVFVFGKVVAIMPL